MTGSTIPPAALVGHNLPSAPVEHVAHPGAQHDRACPNCLDPTSVIATYNVRSSYAVTVARIDATGVEVEPDYTTASPDEPGNWQRPVKVACANCQWSYEGPDPLGRLVETRSATS